MGRMKITPIRQKQKENICFRFIVVPSEAGAESSGLGEKAWKSGHLDYRLLTVVNGFLDPWAFLFFFFFFLFHYCALVFVSGFTEYGLQCLLRPRGAARVKAADVV